MAYTVSSANQLEYLGSVWADPLELQNLCTSALGNPIVTGKHNRDRKSTRLNSSHITRSRMPSSA